MRKFLLIGTMLTAIGVAGTADAACRQTTLSDDCTLQETVTAPGAPLKIVSFPRSGAGSATPTFTISLQWCVDFDVCGEEDIGAEKCILHVTFGDDKQLIGVSPSSLIGDPFSGFGLPQQPGVIGLDRDNGVGRANDSGGTVQFVASPFGAPTPAETLRILNADLRFDNGVCWAGIETKYTGELARNYR